jgi:L-asparagine oxygenase
MLRIDVDEPSAACLREELGALVQASDDEHLLAHLLRAITSALPVDALASILRFRADPHGPAALLITGLPVDHDLPATPTEPDELSPGLVWLSRRVLLSVAILLGDPVSYRAEKAGVLVQDVFPTRSERNQPSNASSERALGFHTELVFNPTHPQWPMHVGAPNFVLLFGLRCPVDRAPATAFVERDDLYAKLSTRHVDLLREPQFQLMAPFSFTDGTDRSRPWSVPVPLLHGPAEASSMAFDTACGVRATSGQAQEALSALVGACEDPTIRQEVRLRAGELLVLNNDRCAHARSAFDARFDGTDRWIQRVYVRQQVWPALPESSDSIRVLG